LQTGYQIFLGIELQQQVTLRERTPMGLLTFPLGRQSMTLQK
jgi:hypothetical protein